MKKNTILKTLLFPVSITLLVGCTGNPNNSSWRTTELTSSEDGFDEEYYDPEPFNVNPVLISTEAYEEFWNPSSAISFDIKMSSKAAEFIDNYQSSHEDSKYHDYYVPCTFTFTINGRATTYEEVGIRQKGNMSRTHMLIDGAFSLNSLCHYKLSFKETFDDEEYDTISQLQEFKKVWEDDAARKARKKRTLFDMEKIDIKWNRNHDETNSKQGFAYSLFRDAGLLAPHENLARVTLGISGKEDRNITTTYEVLEVIDSVFIKRHFDEARADGDLYKCTWQNAKANFAQDYKVGKEIGIEDNVSGYHPAYDLKTNKKKSNHERLLNLIQVINDKTSSAEAFRIKISNVLDIEGFMLYEAIAFLCGNFDDMRNNANNYYLYFSSGEKSIAYVIPYDFDRCFGAGSQNIKKYFTDFSAESTKMNCQGWWQSNNLYWRTICKSSDSASGHKNVERVEEFRSMYQHHIERLLNEKIVSTNAFKQFVNSYPVDYRGNPDGAGQDNITFDKYLQYKIEAVKKYTSSYDIKV